MNIWRDYDKYVVPGEFHKKIPHPKPWKVASVTESEYEELSDEEKVIWRP